MKRIATVLAALVAALALSAAAGSFGTVDPGEPDVENTVTEWSRSPPGGVGGGGGTGENGTGTAGGEMVDTPPPQTAATADSGGVSPLFVAVFVGTLVACGLLAVALTGDDDRAPSPTEDDSPEGPAGPVPSVDVSYGSPPDSAVVRAWRRLSRTVGRDETATPTETARRATDHGFPADAVATVTEEFEAVRYGDRPATERRERAASEAARRFDESEATGSDAADLSDSGEPEATDSADENGTRDGTDPADENRGSSE